MTDPVKVVRVKVKHDGGFARWAHHTNHASRHVYNRAVSTYLFGGYYLDRVVVDLLEPFRLPKNGDVVGGDLTTSYQAYEFGPSEYAMKYGMYKELTGWRAQHEWLRDCPRAYGRGAIMDASVACRRVVDDNSDHAPFRPKTGRIILNSVDPPVRRGDHTVYVPGFGAVETSTKIDPTWDMRSFRVVDATDRITGRTTPAHHKFELHIAVKIQMEPRRPTGVIRAVDVGGRHLAATADTGGNTAVHDTVHKPILREIDALKSIRDRHIKGGRRWSRINKKIRRLRTKADGLATNTINQTVAKIVMGTDAVATEGISVKDITARGGNRKKNINRPMRENRAGEFLRKLDAKCLMTGREMVKVNPAYTSQTCHACSHVDPDSRVSRAKFVCTNCHREFHADVNAAANILHRAAGMVVLRRPEPSWGNQPKPRMLPVIAAGAPRKGMGRAGGVNLCI